MIYLWVLVMCLLLAIIWLIWKILDLSALIELHDDMLWNILNESVRAKKEIDWDKYKETYEDDFE